jgi:PAS domain S-box-containing protein
MNGFSDAPPVAGGGAKVPAPLGDTEPPYRSLVEDSSCGFYVIRDERFVYVNPRFAEIFGYTVEEILALDSALEIAAPEDRALVRENIRRQTTGETSAVAYSIRGLRKDGLTVRVDVYGSRADHQGWPAAMGTVVDVTERRRAEETLHESEAPFRALAEATSTGIFVYQGSRLRYANRAVENLTGYSREELFAMEVWDLAHPELRAKAREMALARQRNEPVPPRYELRILTKEGEERWLDLSATTFLLDGRPAVVGAVFDITARKRAEEALRAGEERYRRIGDRANEGVWMLDAEGRIDFLNRRMGKMLGYGREEMLGRPFVDFMDEETREQAKRHLERCRQGFVQTVDFPFRRKDGSSAWLMVSCSPVPTGEGHYDHVVATLVDVTDRKLAEDALKESERRLRALLSRLESVREEERTRMAREIHDELGQTLTGIKMDLSWLRRRCREPLDLGQPELESRIESMMRLMDSTLDMVRRLATELRPVVLDSFGLEAALKWQISEFQKRTGLRCTLSSEGEEAPLDRSCSRAIFRIFQEAMTNIARHAQATAVRVTLARENGGFLLKVADNGVGIAPEKLTDAAALGLMGMRERARAFGGSVTLGRDPGGGTLVEVRVPLTPADSTSPVAP